MLKKIGIGLAVVIAGVLAFAATQPDQYRVERSLEIKAPPDVVFAQLDDFHAWPAWSPWEKLDPSMTKTYEGTDHTVGASYSWQGNSDVGKGKMTITEREQDRRVAHRLEFIEPFASVAASTFTLEPKGNDVTRVTWAMDGENAFVGKVFGLFMDMDKMIGADFERGLAALDGVAQVEATKKAQAQAELAAKQQAEAAAEAKRLAEAAAAATPTK